MPSANLTSLEHATYPRICVVTDAAKSCMCLGRDTKTAKTGVLLAFYGKDLHNRCPDA